MSNTLRDVIKEEMSNILQKADEVDLDDRDRKDRMQPADGSGRDGRWYDNSKNEGSVRDKLRQIVSEEYETLRNEPETSIEHRSGLRDFDASGSSDAWYMNENGEPDTEKIEEAAKKATQKIIREMGEDTFRARAENARSKDHLMEIFQDITRYMTNDNEELLDIVTQAMSRDGLQQSLQYIDRQEDVSYRRDVTFREQAEGASMDELINIANQMGRIMGHGKLMDDIALSMSRTELENLIKYIDRMYDITPVQAYEQPIGKSMR